MPPCRVRSRRQPTLPWTPWCGAYCRVRPPRGVARSFPSPERTVAVNNSVSWQARSVGDRASGHRVRFRSLHGRPVEWGRHRELGPASVPLSIRPGFSRSLRRAAGRRGRDRGAPWQGRRLHDESHRAARSPGRRMPCIAKSSRSSIPSTGRHSAGRSRRCRKTWGWGPEFGHPVGHHRLPLPATDTGLRP